MDLSPIRRCLSTKDFTPPSGKYALQRACESSEISQDATTVTTPDPDKKTFYTRDKFTLRKELRIVKLQ